MILSYLISVCTVYLQSKPGYFLICYNLILQLGPEFRSCISDVKGTEYSDFVFNLWQYLKVILRLHSHFLLHTLCPLSTDSSRDSEFSRRAAARCFGWDVSQPQGLYRPRIVEKREQHPCP